MLILHSGELPEWLNGAVSKTVVPIPRDRGFESLTLRKCPDGGTGRRAAFRAQWLDSRAGSIPVPGTNGYFPKLPRASEANIPNPHTIAKRKKTT